MTVKRNHDVTAMWEAAARAASAIGEETTLEALSHKALEQWLAVLNADAGELYLLEVAGHDLEPLAQRGLDGALESEEAGLRRAMFEASSLAADTGKLQLVADVGNSPAKQAPQKNDREQSELAAVPLRARGEVVGILAILRTSRTRFDHSELSVLEFLAHELAIAILNSRASEPERRMRATFQALDEAGLAITSENEPRRVLQAILERAREIAGARYAALGIGTDPDRSFEPWLFSGLDEKVVQKIGPHPRPVGLLGAVPAQGHTIRLPDLMADPRFRGWPAHHPDMHSFLGVPIRWRGEAIGNLYLAEKIGAPEFTIDDERAVSSLAAHAAIAYRHAQLYAEAQLQRSRLQAVVASSPLGIIFVEKDTGYSYANKAAEELFGRPLAPTSGPAQYLAEARRPDGEPLSPEEVPSNRALSGEHVVGKEIVMRRADGRELTVLVDAAPIRDAQGVITGAVVLWQDVTPLKLERLREEFISVVAHELRTPITVIAGYADLLARGKEGEPARRAIDSIRISTKRLDRLVRDLLDASRIEARRLQLETRPVAIDELVQDVVDRMKEVLSGRTVHVIVPREPLLVQLDPGRIEQVIANLLINAAKYSAPESAIEAVVDKGQSEVVVSVRNEGPGIAKEELPRLFTRFYRTATAKQGNAPGIGLGLYVARGLVEAHGGRIWATSEPGKKTAFCFALPVSAA